MGLLDPLMQFITTYHMPLFFMISGFLFSSSFDLSFKDFFRKKFTSLIIPHIAWNIIIGLVNGVMPLVGWKPPFSDKPFTILSQIYTFFFPDPLTDFWFFRDLFVAELIVFVFCKIFKKRNAAIISSFLFVLLFSFFGLNGKMLRYLMPIFLIGILLKTYYPIFCKHLNKILIISGIIFLSCFLYKYDYTSIYFSDIPPLINVQQSFAEGKLVLDFTNTGISNFRLLIGIVGSIFFFALFQRFWKKNTVTSFFSRCGQLTVGVYGIQSIILQRIMNNTLEFANVNIWIYWLIITPITATFVLVISVFIISLTQRNKLLAFILFGSSVIDRGFVRNENQRQASTHSA
jgi:fucose 4-O-acetylase-like acetyltransferase